MQEASFYHFVLAIASSSPAQGTTFAVTPAIHQMYASQQYKDSRKPTETHTHTHTVKGE